MFVTFLVSKYLSDSDLCHNHLHTLYMFVCLQQTYALFDYAYKTNISRNSNFKYGLSLKVFLYIRF